MSRQAKVFASWVLCIFIAGSLIVIYPAALYKSDATVTATVVKTERVAYGSGDSIRHKYLIFTDGEVFQCTDSLLFWKFNSSDIYGRLQPNQEYTFRVAGWRWHFGSWYRNVIEATAK